MTPRRIVIVGASLTGATAAATLREEGFDGRITLIGEEPLPPYERPPLSKELLRGEMSFEDTLVRPETWYEEHSIEARLGVRAERVDLADRAAVLGGGRVPFDGVLVATGSRNRTLDVEGATLPGVVQLRVLEDAERIRAAAVAGARVVCVGMGFIGAEVAASLREIGSDVTVLEMDATAMFRVLGPAMGGVVEAIHRDHGIRMQFGDAVERFEGDGRLERVVTKAGRAIEADLAVVGVGTEPRGEVLAGSGFDLTRGIPVGATLETEVGGVFAAGDVAFHDHPVFGPMRVEHYEHALASGVAAARNLLGAAEPYADPHWFWSDQFDSRIEVAGFAPRWSRMAVRGSIDDRSFCAFLLDDEGVVRSTVSIDWRRDVRRSFAIIAAQAAPDPRLLADPEVDLRTLAPRGV